MYEYEWIYSNSQFVNSSTDDQTLAETIASSIEESTDADEGSSGDSTDTGGSSDSGDSSDTGGNTQTESFVTEERTD